MAVPYTFGTATAAIPLSQLDSNFATAITLGNTAVYLGNTTTSIGNLTLTNVTISSGSVTITDTTVSGNVTLSGGTANGVAYLNGSKVLTTGSAFVFNGTNVGIGTSSPDQKLTVNSANTSTNSLVSYKQGDVVYGYTGLSQTNQMALQASVQVNVQTTAAVPITFITNNTENMRIDSSGRLLVGTTTNLGSRVAIVYDNVTQGGLIFKPTSETYNGGPILFQNSTAGTSGSISQSTLTVTYNVTSDYRLKTVIGPVANAGQRIDALQPVEYTWKADGSRTRGFLAHQFQEVYASSVTGAKDAVDAEGKPVYQQMQASTSEVIADLVAEIQSLRKRLATAGI